jgi:hypothetical protein
MRPRMNHPVLEVEADIVLGLVRSGLWRAEAGHIAGEVIEAWVTPCGAQGT